MALGKHAMCTFDILFRKLTLGLHANLRGLLVSCFTVFISKFLYWTALLFMAS